MPRVNRRAKKRKNTYTAQHLQVLRSGFDFYGVFGNRASHKDESKMDMDSVLAVWELFRDEILAVWIRKERRKWDGPGPGTRPWAWWKFDAPELLQRTDGNPHPFDNPDRTAHIEKMTRKYGSWGRDAEKTFRGRPSILMIRDDFEAEYEDPANYLRRLGLLLPGEAELLG